jgi:hypothetical protein
MLHLLEGGELNVRPPDSLTFTLEHAENLKSVGDAYEHLALQFWHSVTFVGEEIPIGPCYALGGPWRVERTQPGDGGTEVTLSATPDAQWVMRRGSLTNETVFPGGQGRVLFPRESP